MSRTPEPRMMRLDELLADFADGDEIGWDAEIAGRWATEPAYMERLAASIRAEGISTPVVLGDDGRVWDGHHRIAVARRLGMTEVPVVNASHAEALPDSLVGAEEHTDRMERFDDERLAADAGRARESVLVVALGVLLAVGSVPASVWAVLS